MKKIIVLFVTVLIASQIVQAQGTVYVSSLNPTSTGSPSVASDYWLAALFETGNNAGGYMLDSIQLGMADALGNPSGFTVMLYAKSSFVGAILPGSSLGTLNGSANPSTAGIYAYTPASNLTLSPSTFYFIVLTAGTTIVNGSYEWSESAYPPSASGDWSVDNAVLHSSNGTSGWSTTPYFGIAQFAITATPIPEPSPSWLLLLGSGIFIYARRALRR